MPGSLTYLYFRGHHDGHYTLIFPGQRTIEEVIDGMNIHRIFPFLAASPRDILDPFN